MKDLRVKGRYPPMSWFQRFVQKQFPETAKEMEAESRTWMLRCPSCGHERSYWEIGGIRWKAASANKWVWMRCPACGKFAGHRVYRRKSPANEKNKA